LEKCQAGLGQRDPPPSWPEEEKKTGCSWAWKVKLVTKV
jgi:hypothetical protein